jgi:hypothetical protein
MRGRGERREDSHQRRGDAEVRREEAHTEARGRKGHGDKGEGEKYDLTEAHR